MKKTPKKNPAAVTLGRLGGKAKSPAKAAAVRENAKKGGWPKGRPRKKKEERCPTCGQQFNPDEHEILDCPECGAAGSSACCNTEGRGSLCVKCEAAYGD